MSLKNLPYWKKSSEESGEKSGGKLNEISCQNLTWDTAPNAATNTNLN